VTIGVDSAPIFRFVTEVHDDTSADYLFTYMEKFFCELLLPKVVIFYDDLKITHYPLPTSNVSVASPAAPNQDIMWTMYITGASR